MTDGKSSPLTQCKVSLSILLAAWLSTVATAAPKPANLPKQIFVYNNHYLPSTLDPAYAHGMYERQVLNQLFEGLTTQDPQTLETKPGIAASWSKSGDGKVYTFKLRSMHWSDGKPIT